jgi:hypothetical protein
LWHDEPDVWHIDGHELRHNYDNMICDMIIWTWFVAE